MPNTVIWHSSTETGAPVLNNVAGALDAVLYACLVTGFNAQTASGISVSGGVATVTKSGHGFGDKLIVNVSGATPSELNGNQLITVTGSGAFTYPTTAANGAATGTITIKKAPLGWTRPANSGNVSIYQRSDPSATAMCLRLNDSNTAGAEATLASVRMVWDWTDVNTFSNAAPSVAQVANGFAWAKGANNGTTKPWMLIGDGRTFYLFTDSRNWPKSSYGALTGVQGFGDIKPYKAGDAYACVLLAGESGSEVYYPGRAYLLSAGPSSPTTGFALARPTSGFGSGCVGAWYVAAGNSGGPYGRFGPAYPSPAGNGMVLREPVHIQEYSLGFNHPIRGALRGAAEPLSAGSDTLVDTVLDSVVGSTRRWLLAGFQTQGALGAMAFDLTGPWE